MALNTGAAALFLTGPGQQVRTYTVGFVWGLGNGWKYASERCIVCQVIPKEQDGEYMGIYLFAGQILLWMPSLIFTVLNENGVNMRIGIASVGVSFLVALLAFFLMGDYDEAVLAVEEPVDGGDVEEADADAEAAPSEDVVNMDSRSEQ